MSTSTYNMYRPLLGVVYARVSSRKQEQTGDLHRQVEVLKCKFPGYLVLTDVGSALNFRRPSLIKLFNMISEGKVSHVACVYRDRVVRFGWDFFVWLCETRGVQITVLQQQDQSPIEETADDILAIATYYVNKTNGRRKYKSETKNA
jgi:putative resolvase